MKFRKIGTKFTIEDKRYIVTDKIEYDETGSEIGQCELCDFVFNSKQCFKSNCFEDDREDKTNAYFKLCKAK